MSHVAEPQYAAYAPPAPPLKKGLATASFVLGLLAILGCLIPIVNVVSIVMAIVAIVLGLVAFRAVRKGRAAGKGLAVTGVILAVLAILGAIISNVFVGAVVNEVSNVIEEGEAADAEAAKQFPGATADDVVSQPGGTVTIAEVGVTASQIAPQDSDTGAFLCSTVEYVNSSGAAVSFNIFDWQLQDPAGVIRTVGIFGDNDLMSGELAPGGTVAGSICFEGAADPGQYVLLYSGSIFGLERGAWINTL